jgi:hypothetical protein
MIRSGTKRLAGAAIGALLLFASPAWAAAPAGATGVSASGTASAPSGTAGASAGSTAGGGTSAPGGSPATATSSSGASAPTGGPATTSPTGAPATTGPANEQPGEEASTRFKRGLQLFDEGDYTLALVEFERAYSLAPNYRALYNIALVNVQLGRYADASRTFEQYLHDGGAAIPQSRRDEVGKTLQELKLRTATVDVSTNVATAEVSLDGKPIDAARLHGPMLIDAGEHILRASSPGYQAAYRTVTLAGADRVAVRLQLVAIPEKPVVPQERGRNFFWPGFVATGVLATGAIATGAVMLDARSRLTQLQNTPASSASERAKDASEVNNTALAADILTGLAVATGAVSLYLSLRVDHSLKPVTLAVSPQKVTISGTF